MKRLFAVVIAFATLMVDAIPAISYAMGGGSVEELKNVDLMGDCEAAGWPTGESVWRHSDIKNVAYYHSYKFYDRIVKGDFE